MTPKCARVFACVCVCLCPEACAKGVHCIFELGTCIQEALCELRRGHTDGTTDFVIPELLEVPGNKILKQGLHLG